MKKIFNTIILASIVLSGATQAAVTVKLDVGEGTLPDNKVYFKYHWIGNTHVPGKGMADNFGFFAPAAKPIKNEKGEIVRFEPTPITHNPDAWNIKRQYEVYIKETPKSPQEDGENFKRIRLDAQGNEVTEGGENWVRVLLNNTVRDPFSREITISLPLIQLTDPVTNKPKFHANGAPVLIGVWNLQSSPV